MTEVGSGINCGFVSVGLCTCTDQCPANRLYIAHSRCLLWCLNNLFLAVSLNRGISFWACVMGQECVLAGVLWASLSGHVVCID